MGSKILAESLYVISFNHMMKKGMTFKYKETEFFFVYSYLARQEVFY